jgi:glycosyltransferase involved in cell wall biosynthesis
MARLLMAALDRAGFAPELTSRMRSHDPAGDTARQVSIREAGLLDAERIVAAIRGRPVERRPRLWFTYHVYYKAPDWIGPTVADALAIPYVAAEGSRAMKRASGPWSLGHAGAQAALDRADVLFAMTAADRVALERHKPAHQRLVDLPPFIDLAEWTATDSGARAAGGSTRLLAVAMMRPGDKLHSYRILADALARLGHLPWALDIVGDGDARGEVEAAFAGLAGRVRFHGRIDSRQTLQTFYEAADLFVWPAVNEAYGMVLLEAQAHGCPVVAGAYGGVASVVRHGETGILTHPGDAADFAGAVAALIEDRRRRAALGAAARSFVRRERTLGSAAAILRQALAPLVGIPACA